ncbi:UTP--glucose-1-phosphate uridylyltransferase [Cichlidogyrus casuarinus]|uniref:UTP--glucose-1-phosphate uridylyltransferase n=1 Tax=Cichlidogyrus casuarinus TaxID=1844966 RepID=A0ABD2Q022_9PLAT
MSRFTLQESSVFKELTLRDAEKDLKLELEKLLYQVPYPPNDRYTTTEKEFNNFRQIFHRFLNETDTEVDWAKIEPVAESMLKGYDSLPPEANEETLREHLNKLVVVKLNGGLGTSMGCSGPKSVISVRDDLTFLDLTIQQIENLNNRYKCNIPLVLMNSFNTDVDTNKIIRKYLNVNVRIFTFMQSMYPRLDRESLLPIATQPHSIKFPPGAFSKDSGKKADAWSDEYAWYPPGHGDFYRSFINSGLAEQFSEEGKKWVYLSNIDNLGATVDTKILNYLCSSSSNSTDFVMEVTDKTRADIKGGTLINYEGKSRLLEMAQVPKDKYDEFISVRKFKIFNTNNLWMNLESLIGLVKNNKMHMEVIKNPKTLNNGCNIIQLEEAAGAAIKNFSNGIGINVPRSRFLPVKTTSDLLLIMSNLYEMSNGSLYMSPKRSFPSVPLVKLGSHFKKVKDFLTRFENIPDLLELDQLTVAGDVFFGKELKLRGSVIIISNPGEHINLPSGSILENKIVSGNLRILDH